MLPSVVLLLFSSLLYNTSIHVRAGLVSGSKRQTTSNDGLTSASWIWIPGSNGSAGTTSGNVAFIKSFVTPSGKTASSAVISMTAVDHFTVWCNGLPIGASGTTGEAWKSAQALRATLNASSNVFSILVTNSGGSSVPPGLLAAIQVTYSDATSSTLLSDASWLAAGSDIPSGFPVPSNLSGFSPPVIAAPYGSGAWGKSVSLPSPDLSPLTLQSSTWIWSTPNATQTAPVGNVGFRKTFATPAGKAAQSAIIILTCDNNFDLFSNGEYVGSPPQDHAITNWHHPQQFALNLTSTSNVFTILAQNFPFEGTTNTTSAAGLIAAIKIIYADSSSDVIVTDSSWLAGVFTSQTAFLSTSDSLLLPSIVQGPLGTAPWTELDSPSNGLNAALVPTSPFSSSANTSPAPSSTAHTSPESHSVPVAEIVAPIIAVLVLMALLAAFFLWRRSTRSTKKHRSFPLIRPFSGYTTIPTNDGSTSEPPSLRATTPMPMGEVGAPLNYAGPPPGYDDHEFESPLGVELEPTGADAQRRKSPW
ncbi:hypothetical protein B0H16DRAFT_880087 [Mycena metata]|uniref:Uncharacterized protein n=1 Tax=Mycena metata TaxID=1033252 RepID=A0AAD7K4F2_9AGAR|nr:hypothetical protein B0H16DRAFT_880087 [Mycena metata]